MSCSKDSLADYLADFGGQNPIDAVICPFAQGAGGGLGETLVILFIAGFLGLGLTIRTQHPGPILVAGILSAGLFASGLPGIGAQMFAIVLFFGIAAVAFVLYRNANRTL